MFKKIDSLRFWCNKILPLVYDDSLSYYETLCKIAEKLNEIINDMNNLPQYIADLISDEKLKEIMSTLLNNLQEQIASANEGVSKTATEVRTVGELVWLNGELYKITHNMIAGDQYVVDSNCEKITIEEWVNNFNTLLENSIINEKEARENSDNNILKKFPIRVAYVREYGAIGDGIADDTQAIKNAINSLNGNGIVVFDPLVYRITDTIVINKSFTQLKGYLQKARQLNPTIVADFKDKDVIRINNETELIEGCGLENITVTRKNMGFVNSKTINVTNCLYTYITNCGFSLSQFGLYGNNINGLIVTNCHGTTGGDLSANDEVCGIYIDGENNVGNSGLLVKGYIYYGYDVVNSISYGIKTVSTAQGGDLRIYDVECSGDVNYGISINAGDGFSSDVIIDGLSMDSVLTRGAELKALNGHEWQNATISNVWLNITSTGFGISCEKYNNICLTNICINSNKDTSTGINFENVTNFSITNFTVNTNISKLIQVTSCINGVINGMLSTLIEKHAWVTNSTNVIFNSCCISGTIQIPINENTKCYKNNCIDKSSNTVDNLHITEWYVNSGKNESHQFQAILNGVNATSDVVEWYLAGQRGSTTIIDENGVLSISNDETQNTIFVLCRVKNNTAVSDICVVNIY